MKINKLRFRGATTSLMIAISQIIGGSSLGIFFTIMYFAMRAVEDFSNLGRFVSRFMLIFLYLGVVMFIRGIQNCVIFGRYRKLQTSIINRGSAASLNQIADELATSPAKILSDVEMTINRRYWKGYGLSETTLVLVDISDKTGTVICGPDMYFNGIKKRSRASFWFFISVWIISLILGVFPHWYGYIALSVVSLTVLVLAAQLLPRRVGIEQRIRKAAPIEKVVHIKTGEPEADDLLGEGLEHLKSLIELDRRIIDEKLDKPVKQLLDITRQIFDYIKKAPEKAKQIRQFVKYYLPTTIKLLENYDELSRQPVKGENITGAINKIEGIMDGILFTFSQQLDDLYRDRNIDISADISVMENMINQDDVLNRASGAGSSES